MIEFKKNGPYVPQQPKQAHESAHVKIVGIGSAGVNVVDQLVLDQNRIADAFVLDTDRQVLASSVVLDKYLLGKKSLRGLNSGADAELACRLFEEEADDILAHFQAAERVVLVVGLGGGTGSGVGVKVVEALRKRGVQTVVLALTPFADEGKKRMQQARQAADVLRKSSDLFLLFSTERMLDQLEPGQDVRCVFQQMNRLLGHVCSSLGFLLSRPGLVELGLEDLKEIVGKCPALKGELENCWIGFGNASGEGRVQVVVEQALASSLFMDGTAWQAGDRIVACMQGGSDMAVSEYQQLIECLKEKLPVELPITASASIRPDLFDALHLLLMVVRSGEAAVVTTSIGGSEIESDHDTLNMSDQSEEQSMVTPYPTVLSDSPADSTELSNTLSKKKTKAQRYFSQQEELPLNAKARRGRFEKVDPTILNGEDLDQPTFMRWGIKIRL